MSGTASVSNAFTSVTSATGAQLDANFNTIVAYINDPTNRNNYAADTGSTNTIALTFAPAVVGGYTAGLEITFKPAFTNTGAVLVNANGLGNKSLINADGTALSSGQLVAGSVYKAAYDGTQFIGIFGAPTLAATAAQQSAAVSITTFTSPGRQQNHPSAAKAWAAWPGTITGTVTAFSSYNVASIVRAGVGTYSIALTTAFATTAWAAIAISQAGQTSILSQNSTSVVVRTADSAGNDADTVLASFVGYGTQ
jgi:hypothetical protein